MKRLTLDRVDTAALLRFLGSCQGLAAATVNRRLAAIDGLFTFQAMRDPAAINPMPKGPAGRRVSASGATGCWVTWPARGRALCCITAAAAATAAGWNTPKSTPSCRASPDVAG